MQPACQPRHDAVVQGLQDAAALAGCRQHWATQVAGQDGPMCRAASVPREARYTSLALKSEYIRERVPSHGMWRTLLASGLLAGRHVGDDEA